MCVRICVYGCVRVCGLSVGRMVMHSPDEAATPYAANCIRLVLTSSEIMATSS